MQDENSVGVSAYAERVRAELEAKRTTPGEAVIEDTLAGQPVRFFAEDGRRGVGTGVRVEAWVGARYATYDLSQLTEESLGGYVRAHGGWEEFTKGLLGYRSAEGVPNVGNE